MSPDEISLFAFIFTILVFLLLRQRARGRKRILLTEYQRGVRFVGGQAADVLLPGSYRINTNKETVLTVDMRVQPILIERLFYRDALNRSAVISIAAELLVSDPAVSATTLKDQVSTSYEIIVGALRDFLSRRAADVGRDGLPLFAEQVTAVLNVELTKVGMAVNPVDITEAWVAPFSVAGVAAPLS